MIPPPPVQTEFWEKEGFPKFVKFWEVCNRLFDALNKLTLNAGVPKDPNESLIRTLCIFTGIASADVSMLVAHGSRYGRTEDCSHVFGVWHQCGVPASRSDRA